MLAYFCCFLSRRKFNGFTFASCSLAVIMFAPVIFLDIDMMSLAFGVALSALLLIEWVRIFCRHYELNDHISEFFKEFTDERDEYRGIAVTHLYLLIGCALPVWASVALSLLPSGRGCFMTVPSELKGNTIKRILSHLGWVVVGVGDSMVSLKVRYLHFLSNSRIS